MFFENWDSNKNFDCTNQRMKFIILKIIAAMALVKSKKIFPLSPAEAAETPNTNEQNSNPKKVSKLMLANKPLLKWWKYHC